MRGPATDRVLIVGFTGRYWLEPHAPARSAEFLARRCLAILRRAVADGQVSLAQMRALVPGASGQGWGEIERAVRAGALSLSPAPAARRRFSHQHPGYHEQAPPLSAPEAIVDTQQSLAILSCDAQLPVDGPLCFRYALRGFEGHAVQLCVYAQGLGPGPVHRRTLTSVEAGDGAHDGTWDGIVSDPGLLAGRRLPANRGPCRIELLATETHRDEAPFELARPRVPVVVLAGHGFASDHAVLLPDVRPEADHRVGRVRAAALVALAFMFAEAERQPGTQLLVVGHTDTAGAAAANQDLARARAENVAAYLRAGVDPQAWPRHCATHGQVADQQRVLAWIHRRFAAQYDCDPGAIDGEVGPVTRAATDSFCDRHAALTGQALASADRFGVEHWRAVMTLYDQALDALLGDALTLEAARATLEFATDPGHIGYGEAFPAREPGVDDNSLEDNRRVELVLLADPGHALAERDDDPGAWLYGPSPCVDRDERLPTLAPAAGLEVIAVEADYRPISQLRLALCDGAGSVFESWTDARGAHRFAGLHGLDGDRLAQLRVARLEGALGPGLEVEPASRPAPTDVEITLTLSLLDPAPLQGISVELDVRTYLVLDRPVLHIPTPSLLHAARGSVLLTPGPWTEGRHPLAGVVHPLVSLLDHPDRSLFIVAHASALGSKADNQALSEARRDALRALLDDERGRWVELADQAGSLRDALAYFDYLGRRRGWACAAPLELLDPQEPDVELSQACVSAFQSDYNQREHPRIDGEGLAVDGACGPKTFAAMFNVLRDELARWLAKLGTSLDALALDRVHYRAYGEQLAAREAEPSDAQAAHARRIDMILYQSGAADDEPAALELAELYDSPVARRLPLRLPHEPHEWASGPLSIVSDLTEHERFEPETYRLRADDGSVSDERVIPDDATIEAGEYVLHYEALPTDQRYSLVAVGEGGAERTIFSNLSYAELHGERPTLEHDR